MSPLPTEGAAGSSKQSSGDTWWRKTWHVVRAKGPRYWCQIGLFIVLAMMADRGLEETTRLNAARDRLSQVLLEWYWRPPRPHFVKLVLIRDEAGEPYSIGNSADSECS
jgi:hypothetical protein